MKAVFSAIPKSILIGLLLTCAFFASVCFLVLNQAASPDPDFLTQESFGYRFEPDQELARGRDDEPASIAGPEVEPTFTPPARDAGVLIAGPTLAPGDPASPDRAVIALDDPPEQRVPGITPTPYPTYPPYPEEWMSAPSGSWISEPDNRIIVMIVLGVLIIVAGVGVVRNW